jgi:dihydropteroate synthase
MAYHLPAMPKGVPVIEDVVLPGGRRLPLSERPLLMGILNVTEDSFYDGGRYNTYDAAIKRAEQMLEEGADIIDIGGESTRPGAEPVPASVELQRVIPLIKALRQHAQVPVSIDTYKAEVAREALSAGADIVNDISGLRFDHEMIDVLKTTDAPFVIMHIQGTPRDMQKNPYYVDVVKEVRAYFEERYGAVMDAGLDESRIILDPVIGFGKKTEHNLALISHLDELSVHNRPILIGASRKKFIGTILEKEAGERLTGTLAVTAVAVFLGAAIIRVHDVAPNLEALHIGLELRKARMSAGGTEGA